MTQDYRAGSLAVACLNFLYRKLDSTVSARIEISTNLYGSLETRSSLLRRLYRPLPLCVSLLLLLKGKVFKSSIFFNAPSPWSRSPKCDGSRSKNKRFERIRNTSNILTVAPSICQVPKSLVNKALMNQKKTCVHHDLFEFLHNILPQFGRVYPL